MIAEALIRGVLLPAGVSFLASWLLVRAVGRQRGRSLAIALGYVAGDVALRAPPPFPPIDSTQWLPFAALAAAVIDFLLLKRGSFPVRWISRVLGAVLFSGFLLRPLIAHSWGIATGLSVSVLVAAALLGVAWAGDRLAAKWPSGTLPIASGTSGAAAILLVLSGSALLGQLAGALAVAAGVLFFLPASGKGEEMGPRFLESPWSFLFVLLLASGYFYSNLWIDLAVLVALAPLAAFLGDWGPLARLSPLRRSLIRYAAVGLVLAGAVSLAGFRTIAGAQASPY